MGAIEIATFAAGRYFDVEKWFAHDFARDYPGAIIETAVGFMSSVNNRLDPFKRDYLYMDVLPDNTKYV